MDVYFFKRLLLKYGRYVVLAGLIYLPLFGHLNNLPIQIWDESRLSINAFDMMMNGNFMVTYADGEPDMWNTKPPLLIWLQCLLLKTIGINELAIRLPSAFAAFFTCLLLLLFSIRYLKDFWLGFIMVLVMVTAGGYIHIHGSRTGDYDALLILFTTLAGLYFFLYHEHRKTKHLYYFFLYTTLAVMTKSIVGLLFLPALALYSLSQKMVIPLLKNKHFYIGMLGFFVVVLGYYFLRESLNPGYIAAVIENELGGRFLEVMENHEEKLWFYHHRMLKWRFYPWYLMLPLGMIVGFFSKNKFINRLALFCTLMAGQFLLVITVSQTKLGWYDLPAYPFMSILVALFLYFIFSFLRDIDIEKTMLKTNILPYLFLLLVFMTPYQKIWDKCYLPEVLHWEEPTYRLSHFLKNAVKKKDRSLDNVYIVDDGYPYHYHFYTKHLNYMGIRIGYKKWEELEEGDVILTIQDHIKHRVAENYHAEYIHTRMKIDRFKINGKKLAHK